MYVHVRCKDMWMYVLCADKVTYIRVLFYVCVRVRVCVCAHICTCTCMCMCAYMYVYVYVYVGIYVMDRVPAVPT